MIMSSGVKDFVLEVGAGVTWEIDTDCQVTALAVGTSCSTEDVTSVTVYNLLVVANRISYFML